MLRGLPAGTADSAEQAPPRPSAPLLLSSAPARSLRLLSSRILSAQAAHIRRVLLPLEVIVLGDALDRADAEPREPGTRIL